MLHLGLRSLSTNPLSVMSTRITTLTLVLMLAVCTVTYAQDTPADAGTSTPADSGNAAETTATTATTSSATRSVISTLDAPAAIGPYSQAIQVGNVLYCSGQIGIDPGTNLLVQGGIGSETRQVMNNLRMVLKAAGYSFDDVVSAQIFMTDLDQYETMNQVYQSYFFDAPPARSTMEVARLPRGASIEIVMTAAK